MKGQLALWSEGSDTVVVRRRGQAIEIRHEIGGASAGGVALPYSRGLLVALREACEQALRGEGVAL